MMTDTKTRRTRTDAHRPGAIVPTDYYPLMSYSLATTEGGWPVPSIGIEQVIAFTAEAHTAGHRVFGSVGKCGICGACFIYGDLWKHESGELVHVGHDCADKYSMVADRQSWERENGRVRARAARVATLRGRQVKVTATLKPGRDAHFAIMSRPKAELA